MAYPIWSPPGSCKAAGTYYVEGKGKYIKWQKIHGVSNLKEVDWYRLQKKTWQKSKGTS